ncbi:Crp/Fnr family transcriptional regulator [Bosea psychrotolerans]|uniref:CRP-like cAMP-binding protein n=1 Tax=Bosea psychrotolerans TaxID=1871628 RepID=A0A2S4LSW9_9HYPH|nr:Crp/Fnr family transcriptional regulator [Bosea psychrotolerans]POR45551.1 CRP-like cAMP-binding protein [Bosea psychrotolerans]
MAYRSTDALAPLVVRLRAVVHLTDKEAEIIRALPFTVREVKAGWEIVREGDRPSQSCLILDGVSCRFKIVGDGGRQIVSVHIPGDLPDLQSFHLKTMDHNLATLTPSRIGLIPHSAIHHLMMSSPRMANILAREGLIDGSIFREWICNIGRRPALTRVAHFLCEIFVRYRLIGANDGMTIPFAFTQTELADAQGTSTVHINRVLKVLKTDGMISIAGKALTVHDWEKLQETGDFDARYLHLSEAEAAAV